MYKVKIRAWGGDSTKEEILGLLSFSYGTNILDYQTNYRGGMPTQQPGNNYI